MEYKGHTVFPLKIASPVEVDAPTDTSGAHPPHDKIHDDNIPVARPVDPPNDEDDLTGPPDIGLADTAEEHSHEFRNLAEEATSLEHITDYIPKNPYCHACRVGKLQPQQSRRSRGLGPPPTRFGVQVTADHILSRSDRSEGITGELDALLIYDRGTTWIDCYPVKTQSPHDVYTKFLSFIGPLQEVQYVHTDDSRALKAALDELKDAHDSSTPGRPKTNGVA